MNRRTYLSALTLGITGCVSTPNTANIKANSNMDSQRTISIVSSSHVPAELKVTMDATVTEPLVTSDHTAAIKITLRNEAKTDRKFTGGSEFPFSPGLSEPLGLVLLNEDSSRGKRKNGCWIVEGPDEWLTNATVAFLNPGETTSITMTVWDDPRHGTCFSPGKYRFSQHLSAEQSDGSESTTFGWEFTLGISK